MFTRRLSLLLFALMPATAMAAGSATTTVTISRLDVVIRATEQNPQVASARAEIHRYEALQNQVFAARFPTIGVQVGVATSLQAELVDENGATSRRSAYKDFSFDQLSAAFLGRVLGTQPLYTFGKIDLRGEAATAGLRASRAQVRMTQAGVALEAAKIYEGLLYAKAVLLFLDDIQGIAEKTLEQTEDLIDEGAPDVSIQDILRVKSAQGLAELGRTEAEAGISQATEGLRAYLGLGKHAEIIPQDEYLAPISIQPTRVEDVIDLALNNRPEFDALKQGILAFDKLAAAEAAGYFPNIFLAGLVTAAYTPGRQFTQSRYVFDPLGHFVPAALIGAQWEIQWDMAGQRAEEVRADAIKLTGLLKWAEQGIPAEVNQVYQ
ncbi:MAG: TolC family protein, partial [Myxococcota bacterium]